MNDPSHHDGTNRKLIWRVVQLSKNKPMKKLFASLLLLMMICLGCQQSLKGQSQKTYCNPVNLDYGFTPIPNFSEAGRHRATADPVIVRYKDDFYLFSTNQWGYWWSEDLLNWKFISRKFLRPWNAGYDELCAPAVGVLSDTMLVFGSTYTKNFTLWMSADPKHNQWKPLVDSLEIGGWDPAFFTDKDGKFYMYNGSSNRYPLYGIELNRKTMQLSEPEKSSISWSPGGMDGKGSENRWTTPSWIPSWRVPG